MLRVRLSRRGISRSLKNYETNTKFFFFFSPNARVLFSGFGGKNVLLKMYKWNKINDSDIGKLTKWWSHYKADKQQDYYHTFDSFNRFG